MNPAPATDSLPEDALARHSPRPLPLPGEFVGPYRLIFELASGGMATIYLAIPERRFGAHRFVAVKRLHRHLADDPNFRKMFLDEARIASHLRHPNVCAVFDYDDREGAPYIVMEYLAGEPVSAVWKALPRGGSPAETRRRCVLAARIAADICEALHAAHELRSIYGEPLNVVHRDVSPENLILTYDGVVKLCDFGIAIAERQEHETEAGMLKGKYAYMQPEVLRGERPDRRADVFSIGVVLWELMTGARLFRRDSAVETLQAVSEAVVPAPSTFEGVPAEFDAAVLRALASDPSERFQSARDFAKALDTAMALCGSRSGLSELSEWMEELFPGGRTTNEHTIELVATLYDPKLSVAKPSDAGHDDAQGEAATVAVPSTLPPAAKVPSLRAATARRAWSNARWPRPLFTFALGAFLGAQYFSPSRPNWPAAENARATELAAKAPAKDQPSYPAESPNAATVPVEPIGRLACAAYCDANAALADPPQKEVDLKSMAGTSPRGARARELHARDLGPFVSEAVGVLGPRIITPVSIASTIVANAELLR